MSVKGHAKGALYGVGEKKKVDFETEVAESMKLEDGREIMPVIDEDGEEV